MPGFDLMLDGSAMRRTGPGNGGGGGQPALNPLAVVIAGDSITSTTPDQTDFTGAFYSYRWKALNPSRTVNVRAQASRTVGGAGWSGPPAEGVDNGSPAGNTLLSNRSEILDSYRPALCTVMIGANDLGTFSVANYINRLIAWAAPIRAAGIKIAYSPPTPYRNSGTLHPNYTTYTARRAALLAQVRDPAVWRQWADYYLPLGEHPDFNDAALIPSLYADAVHPSAFDAAPAGSGGHVRLYAVFEKAMTSLLDTGRATATAPYASVWPVSETNLSPSTQIVRRIIMAGLSHATPRVMAVTGAEIRLNGGAWGTAIDRVYNGDVIDIRDTTSAANGITVSYDLTIGTETRTIGLTTVAAVDPVSYQHGGIATDPNPAAAKTFSNLTFGSGLAVLAVVSQSSYATAVSVGGTAATLVFQQARSGNRGLQIWTCPVSAGATAVTITRAATSSHHVLSYGTLANVDPVAVQAVGSAPASVASPHPTPALTVPANGLALGWLMEEGGTGITPVNSADAGSTFIAEGNTVYQSATTGLAMATRPTSGAIGFNFVFGSFARAGVVFKAAGT